MQEPKSTADLQARLNRAKNVHKKRDDLITHVRELYEMKRNHSTAYFGADASAWRSKMAGLYWQASNRAHNVVDIMTSVLSGNQPQYQCLIPGNVVSTVGNRAEKFLAGAWRINSRRQQFDLYREVVFRTVLDGGVGIRVYWNPNQYEAEGDTQEPETIPNPDKEDGEDWVVKTYSVLDFPIIIDLVPLDSIYTLGRGTLGRPFDQLFHVEKRTANDVIYEWEGVEGVDLGFLSDVLESDRDTQEEEYLEWWGQKPDGKVWHAILFKQKWIKSPAEIDYPAIPYVITTFKSYNRKDPNFYRLPFIFPILSAIEKEEYVSTRVYRMVDLYSNLPPIHRGNTQLNLQGTWGKVANLQADEKLEFPVWPGNPPDIYRLQEDLRDQQSQGTFSQAMFGQASARLSGYGLSQLIGADTTRTDTPRTNLELAFSAIGDLIFAFMRKFSFDIHMAVTMSVNNHRLAAMLSGEETKTIVVEAFVQPKQMSDQVRLAALGAQLASLPNAPVSNAYILEKYFMIPQPEDEMERKMAEEVIKDPVVRMMALLKVLQDNGSPFAALIEQQLQQAVGQSLQPKGGPTAPPGPPGEEDMMAGLGLGLPQATMGNPPIIPASGNPSEEAGFDRTALMMGGPPEEMV